MAERSAVVRIRDKQIRVKQNDVIKVPYLGEDSGPAVEFDEVLLLSEGGADGDARIGTPTVEGARVLGEVLEHGRESKLRVFKFKRRKGYRKTIGHRQDFTQIRITSIEG